MNFEIDERVDHAKALAHAVAVLVCERDDGAPNPHGRHIESLLTLLLRELEAIRQAAADESEPQA